ALAHDHSRVEVPEVTARFSSPPPSHRSHASPAFFGAFLPVSISLCCLPVLAALRQVIGEQ
ncbi:hypothetical protein RUM43_000112, partial [Polyplax serrata]